MNRRENLSQAFAAVMREARSAQDEQSRLHFLERAHLIGQSRLSWHWQAHVGMLQRAMRLRDWREVRGQLLRLALVPLGHLSGRLPVGNVGSTRMGIFEQAEVPAEIRAQLATAGQRETSTRWLVLATAVLLLDQLSKAIVAEHWPLGTSLPVTSFFNLVHVLNPGAAFSFLANAGGWQRHVLSALGIVISLWLAREIIRPQSTKPERLAYALVLGGALGNVWDRVRQGAVTDFLDFHWQNLHWPAFNFADVAICSGVAVLIATVLRTPRISKEGDSV